MNRAPSHLDSFDETVALGLSFARGFGHTLPDALEVVSAEVHTAACPCGKMLIVERDAGRWVICGGAIRGWHHTARARRPTRPYFGRDAAAPIEAPDPVRVAARAVQRQRSLAWHARKRARVAEAAELEVQEPAPVPVMRIPPASAANPAAKVYLPPRGAIAFSLLGQV